MRPTPSPLLQALHIFQEVLDQGLLWGPDITYAMLKASLDVQVRGGGARASSGPRGPDGWPLAFWHASSCPGTCL